MRRAVKKLGLLAIHRAARLIGAGEEGLLVLTYHRISREPEPGDQLKVSLATFDRQMAHIRRRYAVLAGAELVDIIRGRRALPRASCLVTFDDGWEDNHANGLEVLRRHRIPAVVFVSTDFIGTRREFWHEHVRRFLRGAGQLAGAAVFPADLPEGVSRELAAVLRRPAHEREEAAGRLIEDLKRRTPRELERLGDLLGAGVPDGRGAPAMLTWEQVAQMHESGIAFGSHGRTHSILTRLDVPGIAEELLSSREAIARRLGAPPLLLAYPNGDFDDRVLAAAGAAGYVAGFTCLPGWNRGVERPLELRRINVREDSSQGATGGFSEACFEAELSGLRQGLKGIAASRRRRPGPRDR